MKQSSTTITQNQNQAHVSLSLWVRYVPIPVQWSVVENPDAPADSPDERFVLVPEVDPSRWKPSEPLDPFELRTRFLKLDIDSPVRTRDFLNSIGVWNINEQTGEDFMRIERPVGHRYVTGFAAPLTVGALKAAQKRTTDSLFHLRKNPRALADLFGPPPKSGKHSDYLGHASRNRWLNTLPLHMEWHRYGEGVIQPVTGHEMLNVTLQLDLMRNADVQVCTYCEHPFTASRKRDYCDDSCMKAAAQKRYRDKNQSTKWRKTV